MLLNTDDYHRGSIASLFLLMTLIFLSFAAQQYIFLIFGSFFCAFYAVVKYSSNCIRSSDLFIYALIISLFLPAFLKPNHGLTPAFYVFSSISVFFAAKAASYNKIETFLIVFRIMYALSIITIGIILYRYRDYVEPLGMVIEGSSTNAIPAYLIVLQIGLSLSNFLTHKQLPVLSAVTTGVVAFFGNGRGSLVVAGLIIIATLIFNAVAVSRQRQRILHFTFLAVAATCLIIYFEEIFDFFYSYTKLSVGLDDGNRIEIINDYMGKMNLYSLIFGADYSNTVIDYKMHGNPHIAYIRTHSFFGLPLTLLALLSPALVFLSRKKMIEKAVFFVFIGLAALRATSEPIFFPTLLDFFYFTYFFLFFRYATNGKF